MFATKATVALMATQRRGRVGLDVYFSMMQGNGDTTNHTASQCEMCYFGLHRREDQGKRLSRSTVLTGTSNF